MDSFCRINVQSDLPHSDFVAIIAELGAPLPIDISALGNDDYDASKPDDWLHYRYTLELDPLHGTTHVDYVAAIGKLLLSLWGKGMKAVAGAEFEDEIWTDELLTAYTGTKTTINRNVLMDKTTITMFAESGEVFEMSWAGERPVRTNIDKMVEEFMAVVQ